MVRLIHAKSSSIVTPANQKVLHLLKWLTTLLQKLFLNLTVQNLTDVQWLLKKQLQEANFSL